MNVNGSTSTAGGFQPNLTLFNGGGLYVAGQTYPSPMSTIDPTSKQALDSYLSVPNVGAGTYTLTVTDWLNQQSPMATNLSDGFTFNLGSGGSTFVDQAGVSRSPNYSLNFTATSTVIGTPKPSTVFLLLPAITGLAFYVRKQRTAV